MAKVSVRRHLRRQPERRRGRGVRTPKAPEFAPAKLRKGREKPRRAQYVPAAPQFRATRLEDYEVLIEKPPRRPVPPTEPEIARALVGEAAHERWLGGVNQKEVFVLVKEGEKGETKVVGKALFKPASGEPDWPEDSYGVPTGEQYRREVVAYTISDLLGWDIVPPTEMRIVDFRGEGGEGEVGSLQQWMSKGRELPQFAELEKEENVDYARMAVIDIIMQNRDRHANNILYIRGGLHDDIYAIDNGLSLGSLPGLRNDGWSFLEGDEIPASVRNDLREMEEGDLRAALAPVNDKQTVEEAVARWKWLKEFRRFPKRREYEHFMYEWLRDNLPAKEWNDRRKKMYRAHEDHGGYDWVYRDYGDAAYPDD